MAEKVQELNRNEQAVAGTVIAIDGLKWTIKVADSRSVEIVIDDTLTDFFEIVGMKTSELKLKDIEKNDYIFVTGPEIAGSITANSVYRDKEFIVASGKITEVNAVDFSIRVLTVNKTEYVLDIEKKTVQSKLDIQTLKTEKMGFSKLKEGDSVHFVVKANPENPEQTQYSAVRILVVPNEFFLQ